MASRICYFRNSYLYRHEMTYRAYNHSNRSLWAYPALEQQHQLMNLNRCSTPTIQQKLYSQFPLNVAAVSRTRPCQSSAQRYRCLQLLIFTYTARPKSIINHSRDARTLEWPQHLGYSSPPSIAAIFRRVAMQELRNFLRLQQKSLEIF